MWHRHASCAITPQACGIGIDDIISHYALSSTAGLSVAQLYALCEDGGLTAMAEGDIEALLQAMRGHMGGI